MLLFAVAMMTASAPAAIAAPTDSKNCPRTSSYLADQSGLYRGRPLKPRKLTELPPAIGYMAVYRTINGCDAPLTMVEYRGAARR